MEKHGIETLKMFVLWGISLTEQLQEAFKDRRFRWYETFGFADEGRAFAELLPHIDQASEEFKDLSLQEKRALIDFIAQEMELDNEWAERITLDAVDLATASYRSLQTMKAYKRREK